MDEREALLAAIGSFCQRSGMAESTFGRRVANDGKFVSRLREGGHVTTRVAERVRGYIAERDPESADIARRGNGAAPAFAETGVEGQRNAFRFYDNRQKYLLFVTTCSEKWVVAERVGMELTHLRPQPPALRVFDAGMGDGSVLARVMRGMHQRFATVPFYIVAKEISLEDVRLGLEKMPDRFFEHPATVLVVTNLYYSEAPWLAPRSMAAAASVRWKEVALAGSTAHEFEQQITALQPFLSQHWKVRASEKTGNPLYERPTILVIYREDQKFLLDRVIPRPGETRADFDLVIASQPYRARMEIGFKVQKVLVPLATALGPGGRMLVVQSHGNDPGLEIIRRVWPGEQPFLHDRHQMLRALKTELESKQRSLKFTPYSDERSLFTYNMHTLPDEIGASIGTSTLLAAWNAAVYVAQMDDQRLSEAMARRDYLDATREVLQKHGGLWFIDESYVVSRRRA